jgi:hypothetical protein
VSPERTTSTFGASFSFPFGIYKVPRFIILFIHKFDAVRSFFLTETLVDRALSSFHPTDLFFFRLKYLYLMFVDQEMTSRCHRGARAPGLPVEREGARAVKLPKVDGVAHWKITQMQLQSFAVQYIFRSGL